jgi:hypothetical protein
MTPKNLYVDLAERRLPTPFGTHARNQSKRKYIMSALGYACVFATMELELTPQFSLVVIKLDIGVFPACASAPRS